ncbi:insulinase family protein [Treponema zioleckii]|uniref:insulinase family protein n=1 Tax=Treponema zioleckii TaxID=331680 RepID=UPI00168AF388|nr:insulinase family protein [Treponema zioleckii]
MSEKIEKGKNYKDFECLDIFEVADYHSTVVYLRQLKTGLEVFHMVNSDPENLFSFAFKTPNEKSTGAAHILEHSVLCGSENFPLKDPFVNLSNQSVKTYLNAMTYPDRTVFPASSIVKADYFNLMNVYGDAVFFPKLEKEIFLQEAHRLEIDENGTPSIQGVVYNEMKGNYSSFDSVAGDACNISLLRDCIYEKDSGGDPLEIPKFTYEEFLAFHRRWYRPDNCFVFLYGNIPTEEQLDFIQEHFLERLEKKYPDIVVSEKNRLDNLNQFLKYVTPVEIKAPFEFACEGPASEEESSSGDTVVVNWSLGPTENAEKSMLNTVIAGILMNHDGSPLQKALVDSGLGEDMAPQSGLSNYIYHSMLSIGLRGVKKGDAKKVEDLVLNTLQKLADEGIKESDIQSTMMSLEFSQREIKRSGGPYSLVLMNRPIFGWLYGFDVRKQFKLRSILEEIRSKIKNEKGFLENKIRELLIENPRRSLVVVTPSKEFNANRERLEKELIDSLMQKTSVENVKADCEKLHEFQRKNGRQFLLASFESKRFLC